MKKIKKLTAAVLSTILFVLSVTGCSAEAHTEGERKYPEEITIDVFDYQANYTGEQTGWFAKAVKDRFNMKLNIISGGKSESSEILFQTRMANGNVGDLILIGSSTRGDNMVKAGLVLDMTDYISGCENLSKYRYAIEEASALTGVEGLWAVPSEISNQPIREPSEVSEPGNAPCIRFDLYEQIGFPEIQTLEDLLPVLQQMQELAGISDSGKQVYAFSLFRDWDAGIMQNAAAFMALYGWDTQGVAEYYIGDGDESGSVRRLIDDDSFYVRALRFLYTANQMGLIDPESVRQDYSVMYEKVSDGAVLYVFWPWLAIGGYNTSERMAEGKGFASVAIQDMKCCSVGNHPTGSTGNMIMIGSKAQDPQRMMDFIDWLFSPEGIMYESAIMGTFTFCGPEGLTWEYDANGTAVLTDFGIRAFIEKEENLEVPEEWGGGTWLEGGSQLNFPPVGASDIDDETGLCYNYQKWPDYIEMTSTRLSKNWQEWSGYDTTLEYYKANDWLVVKPGTNYTAPAYSVNIKAIKEQIDRVIVDYSWRMVFCDSDEEFDRLLREMQTICLGFGYEAVFQVDKQNIEDKLTSY